MDAGVILLAGRLPESNNLRTDFVLFNSAVSNCGFKQPEFPNSKRTVQRLL